MTLVLEVKTVRVTVFWTTQALVYTQKRLNVTQREGQMSKGKRYTQQFKEEAVKQVVGRRDSVDEVAERLGIGSKSLYDWKSSIYGNRYYNLSN